MRQHVPARELNELLKLDDEALVTTREAAAVLAFAPDTLTWYRKRAIERSPKFQRIGAKVVRYRMGDLRAFRDGDPDAFHIARAANGEG